MRDVLGPSQVATVVARVKFLFLTVPRQTLTCDTRGRADLVYQRWEGRQPLDVQRRRPHIFEYLPRIGRSVPGDQVRHSKYVTGQVATP